METYRVRLKLRAATGTPWHADTVFGHLCWQLRYQEGQAAVEELLELYRLGEPPLVLSDGFPGTPDLLPRPLLPLGARAGTAGPLAAQREEARRQKDARDVAWLTPDEFRRVAAGEAVLPAPKSVPSATGTLKNQINRATATTGGADEDAAGHLYEFEELYWPEVAVYARVAEGCLDLAQRLFAGLAASGYGRRKSIGYGEIESVSWEPCDDFAPPPGANGFVSLSHFVPAGDDPTDGWWRLRMKYGRLGEAASAETPPFKRPLVQLAPGATFRAEPVRPWYGRLVEGVHPARPEVVQYGLAFAAACIVPPAAAATEVSA